MKKNFTSLLVFSTLLGLCPRLTPAVHAASPENPEQPQRPIDLSSDLSSYNNLSGETSEIISLDPVQDLATLETPSLAVKEQKLTSPSFVDSPVPSAEIQPGEIKVIQPQSGELSTLQTNLILEYHATDTLEVRLNGQPLPPGINSTQEKFGNRIVQIWYSIPLQIGQNTFTAQSRFGNSPQTLNLVVKAPTLRLELNAVERLQIPADKRSSLTLQGRILNEHGQVAPVDGLITLTASAGTFLGADQDTDQPGFQVQATAGQFTAQLQSDLNPQKVQIRAAYQSPKSTAANLTVSELENPNLREIEAYTQVEFTTNLRPSILSGVVNLRIGGGRIDYWGSRRDFLNPNLAAGTQIDLETAVFATGKVGEWLFTGAYNSERPLNETCDGTTRLFRGEQFCERLYPVYGDSSTIDYLTPSIDSVYLKFERTSPIPNAGSDYFMWGDYSTTELARSSQLFTATTRQLHGFKGNYNLGNLQLSAFFSPNVQGFQRDTITPNGTSGYYFLSKRLLVEGSETVFVETEELNRPGTVLERKALQRGADYEIDYDRGTLLFRRPIQATELNPFPSEGVYGGTASTLVRRIVASYQYEGQGGGGTNLYAGRLQYNLSRTPNQESWLGATYLRENQGTQQFELYGADLQIAFGNSGQLVGEYARSTAAFPVLGVVGGSAYRLEAFGQLGSLLSGRAYYRSVDSTFSNNATTSFTPGQTRYGANLTATLGADTQLTASYDREDNFGIAPLQRVEFFDIFNPQPQPTPGERVDNRLTTVRAGILQKLGASALSVEYVNRSREDRISNTFTGDASQLVSRLTVPMTSALVFRAQNELNLGSSDPLYPNRTTLGLDWALYPGVTMRLAHQFQDAALMGSNSITSLDTIVSRSLGENTFMTSRYSLIGAYNSLVGQGAIGLNHRWTVSPGLRVSLGYEHIFADVFGATAAGNRFRQPYATGQSASSLGLEAGDAYSIAVEYTESPDFQASARIEHRTGRSGNNTVLTAGAAGKISPSLTGLLRFTQADASNQLLQALGDTVNLKLGLAYRNPRNDRFNGLFSYEYRRNPSTIPQTLLLGSGTGYTDHVVSLEGIYAPRWDWEFYGKYAMRFSTTTLAADFSNSSMVYLAQLRATHRFAYRWDVALEGRLIGQPSQGYLESGLALETGYYLSPDLRASVGYSFGSVDDRDFSGYRSDGGFYFGLTLKLNELGGFGRQRVTPRPPTTPPPPVANHGNPAQTAANQ